MDNYDSTWQKPTDEQSAALVRVFETTGRRGNSGVALAEWMMNLRNTHWYYRICFTACSEPKPDDTEDAKNIRTSCKYIMAMVEAGYKDGVWWPYPKDVEPNVVNGMIAAFALVMDGDYHSQPVKPDSLYDSQYSHLFADLLLGIGWDERMFKRMAHKPKRLREKGK